jgi:hypothetical protein
MRTAVRLLYVSQICYHHFRTDTRTHTHTRTHTCVHTHTLTHPHKDIHTRYLRTDTHFLPCTRPSATSNTLPVAVVADQAVSSVYPPCYSTCVEVATKVVGPFDVVLIVGRAATLRAAVPGIVAFAGTEVARR